MATVHLGRLLGPAGFARTVAIKQLHAQFATDPEFVSMFLDEARLAARIRSPHVVPIVDIVADGGELLLVMDYVQGESLVRLLRSVLQARELVPLDIAVAVIAGALHGLHAAHEATDEQGNPLGIVHRDVSPQNILVGTDGLARLLDFGVAKAAGRIQTTREGQIKGKIAYMAPEQLRSEPVTRRTDVYAAAVVLWETLTCRRLFRADNEGAIVTSILQSEIEPPSR
ncbi:MAG: serine/threonine-protein kinase, partial [Polyangiaceae bacterium]